MNCVPPRQSLSRKLSQYCFRSGGVALTVGALSPMADGAIIYTNVPDTTLAFPFTSNPGAATDLFVDFGSAIQPGTVSYGFANSIPFGTEFRFSLNAQADKPYAKGPLEGNGGSTFFANTGVEASSPGVGGIGGRYASKLSPGTAVHTQNFARPLDTDDSVSYLRTPDTVGSQWAPGETGYLGVRTNIGGNTHHGWAQVRVDTESLTVVDFAYEDTPAGGIVAGQVPEPHSIALLALGSYGIAAMRRRRS